jgi:hypothetical protein
MHKSALHQGFPISTQCPQNFAAANPRERADSESNHWHLWVIRHKWSGQAACQSERTNMIHQHKRIELRDLRKLDDGAYVAKVMVNGTDVSEDPILNDLMETSKK